MAFRICFVSSYVTLCMQELGLQYLLNVSVIVYSSQELILCPCISSTLYFHYRVALRCRCRDRSAVCLAAAFIMQAMLEGT
jgi:tRNA G26 N,N-dimethylase Trm1